MAKIEYSEYLKKLPVSTLVAESIFSDLSSSCKLYKLSKICKTSSGGTPLRSRIEFYDGDIPWLKSGELNDGLITKCNEFITELGLKNSSAKLQPKGSILLAMYGATAGRVGILDFEASTNQAVCAIFPDEGKLDKDFLYWFLRQHRYKFIEISKGGAQPNISQKVINDTLVPLPHISLQRELALLFFDIEKNDKLDINLIPVQFQDKVNSVFHSKNNVEIISFELKNQLSLISQLRQAFLKEAMQGKLVSNETSDGKTGADLLAEIQTEKEKLIKEKKIKKGKPLPPISEEEIPFDIPENWVWCRLENICIKITDGFHHSVQKVSEGYPYISAMHIRENSIKWDNGIFVPEKDHRELFKKAKPKRDDIIITNRGAGCGTPAIIDVDYEFSFQNAGLIGFVNHLISSKYIYYFIIFQRQSIVEFFVNGGLQPMLSNVMLSKLEIPLPPLEIQNRIVSKLEELMTYCDDLETSVKESQNYNEQLLQQVLREALEVKEVAGEVK
ncbi:restriction endonuclease subunit S [Kaistella carnis]|uniref:Type I restriction modification DNA specificity domain-containing protein n=1 Tax=Kaistella carnis TaxID=1241979 RepID=A0A3G8XHN2_9FLAO|nr:restriction endonuclease subunit S [Kaistella carnis]AZI31923.1 hypothetical protein EIB73_01475 [Kaistella carnis]